MCDCTSTDSCSCSVNANEEEIFLFATDAISVSSDHLKLNSNGYLVAPVVLARVGVSQYKASEIPRDILKGLTQKKSYSVLKSEDTLADPEVLASFEDIPVVEEHPNGPILLGDNKGKNILGYIKSAHYAQDTKELIGSLVINSPRGIEAIQRTRKVSIGFNFGLKSKNSDGIDYEQTKIRGNHVALTKYPKCDTCEIIGLDSTKEDNMETISPQHAVTNAPAVPQETFVEWNDRKLHPQDVSKVIDEEIAKALQVQEAELRETLEKQSQEKLATIEKAKEMTGKIVDTSKDVQEIQTMALDSLSQENEIVKNIVQESCGLEGLKTKDFTKLQQAFMATYASRDAWKRPFAKDSQNSPNIQKVFEKFGQGNGQLSTTGTHDFMKYFEQRAHAAYDAFDSKKSYKD